MKDNSPTSYIVNITPKIRSCGKRQYGYFALYCYRIPYQVAPTEGKKHNFRTCEKCKRLHKEIQDILKQSNDLFPNCCENHKKLNELKVFNLNDFKDSHISCANKIIYCYNHILNNQERNDWKEYIDYYIQEIVYSFGCMPKGYGSALFLDRFYCFLKEIILHGEEFIKDEVKIHVCRFLDNLILPSKREKDPIESLLQIYKNWLDLFPFCFPELDEIKLDFENRSPLMFHNNNGIYKLFTNKELIEWLDYQSKELLKKVQIKDGFSSILLDNYRDTIETKELDIEEKQILDIVVADEKIYIETLLKWFEVQKKRINLIKTKIPTFDGVEAENSFKESNRRVRGFKRWIEHQEGNAFLAQMKKIDENSLQILFKGLCSIQESLYRFDREVNNGRGPVDFVISKGSNDSTIIEFKLASNSSLKNILYQVEVYKAANNTQNYIIVIFYFTSEEKAKVDTLLTELNISVGEHLYLVDCRTNKPSASKVKNKIDL